MSTNKATAPTARNVSGIGNFLNGETKMEVNSGGTKARATSRGPDHEATVNATEKAAEKVAALKKAE